MRALNQLIAERKDLPADRFQELRSLRRADPVESFRRLRSGFRCIFDVVRARPEKSRLKRLSPRRIHSVEDVGRFSARSSDKMFAG